MHFVTVYPIDSKFSQYSVGEVLRYARQLKRLIHCSIRYPIGLKTLGYGTVLETVFVSCPALSRKLNEFTVDVFWGAASLLPIKDELWANRFNEL